MRSKFRWPRTFSDVPTSLAGTTYTVTDSGYMSRQILKFITGQLDTGNKREF